MSRKQRRFGLIAAAGLILALAAALILTALNDKIVFFNSPAEIIEKNIKPGTRMRVGGLVEKGTVQKSDGQNIAFQVTDGKRSLKVAYTGLLPDLFREGQGVIAEGILQTDGSFKAETILAKHDETYMPREVAEALKKQGQWQGTLPEKASSEKIQEKTPARNASEGSKP